MTLQSGTRLGPYEIVAPLGAGGMGEVYNARDTRLDRTVAIKVLPPTAASEPNARARFEREARAVAALDHPHICAIYDIGRDGGVDFIVMQYLEGETLASRLQKGALQLDQALRYAIEIADALDKAHRQGVVHRDLKPGNIMLTKSGTRLLDFGLARLQPVAGAIAGLSAVATEAPSLTAAGTILGTLQYMAPEQLEGREADARTDVFAFGAVVYEMATGRKAFEGRSHASLIAAILQRDPHPLSTVAPQMPRSLARIVEICLAKDPDDRWQTTRDMVRELRWCEKAGIDGDLGSSSSGTGTARVGRATRTRRAIDVATGAAVAGLMVWSLLRGGTKPSPDVARVSVSVAPADALTPLPTRTELAFSPDGKSLVFSAANNGRQQLYVRALDRLEATPLAGTESSNSPFFSPNGQWVGFWAGQMSPGATGELKKVPLDGGPAVTICKTAPLFGASWGPGDLIVFANSTGGLRRVSAAGGMPQSLTTPDNKFGISSHRLPQVLPDGRSVLFTIAKVGDRPDDGQIALQSLTGGEPQILIERGADARYVSTGHLVYARDGTLLAVPFDLRRLQVTGAPTGVVGGVTQAVNTGSISLNDTGAAQFTLSASGAMAYLPGGIFPSIDRALVWVDRNGATTALPVPPRQYVGPRLSPDGRRLGVGTVGRDVHVWTYEFSRGVMTRLPFERTSIWTAWTPDSRRLTFYASDSPQGIVSMSPEGGEVERLTNSEGVPLGGQPGSWSPDGRTLAFVKNASTTNWDIWMFSRGRGEHKLRPVLPRPALERYVEFSPDGRWLAYASDESGRDEVYVERYPGSGERQQVSTDGGSEVAWAHSGRELFYAVTSGTVIKMFAVDVSLDPAFRASKPRVLFEGRYPPTTPLRSFDVTADGRHFLMTQNVEQPPAPLLTHIVVVLNWTEELRQRVPTR